MKRFYTIRSSSGELMIIDSHTGNAIYKKWPTGHSIVMDKWGGPIHRPTNKIEK